MKNSMSGLSATNANKSSIHESPKDHSINIDSAAPYFQGMPFQFPIHSNDIFQRRKKDQRNNIEISFSLIKTHAQQAVVGLC